MMSLMNRLGKDRRAIDNFSGETTDADQDKNDLYQRLKEKVQMKLIQLADENKLEKNKIEAKISFILDEVADEMAKEEDILIHNREKKKIISETVDHITGFGPITPLVNDSSITEVMVNGADQVYIEREGKIEKADICFGSDREVMYIIEKIVSPLGRRIDESTPMVDARLVDGSRINAIIPPLSLGGPILTIRKFSKDPYTMEDLIDFGTLNPQIASFLKNCVKARLNIIVSGGTGGGKTTTLNVLSSFIGHDERIITIEDAAEIQLRQEHVVRLETRSPNIEGKGAVSVRDLVRNSLRMRPDRIIVGEVRGAEALDMLQAMNTGHDGSISTGHANSPRDMLARLETMTLMSEMDIPLKAIREQISSAIDLIVHQSRFKDGSRKITQITEVQGMEGDVITLEDIFAYKPKGRDENGKIQGDFVFTGIKPRFLDGINSADMDAFHQLFRQSSGWGSR